MRAFPQDRLLDASGRLSQAWQRFFLQINTGATGGTVTNFTASGGSGITATVTNGTTTPNLSLSLGNITPLSVNATGNVTGANLSGTNTGDQTITLTGDATGSGTSSFAVAVSKIGGKAISLAGSLTTAGAFASTFTMTGNTNVTFPTSGTLATLAGAETLTNKTLTAPAINNPTGTMTLVSGTLGYAAGNGGAVTQATSKSTGVTLNKICGDITLNSASLAANSAVTFTLTNTAIAATDSVILNHISGGTFPAYALDAQPADGSALIGVRNLTAGALAEAVVIRFAVIKAANA